MSAFILWRRLDKPGHEAARLTRVGSSWQLQGSSVFLHDQQPVRLDYAVVCDESFRTRSADVTGWVGEGAVALHIRAGENWTLNGQVIDEVRGCIDVDLNFSPSTNLLPIRRLKMKIGDRQTVRAAWLRFPDFTLEPLEQVYHRTDEYRYGYESGGGSFRSTLETNADGFVVRYPEFFLSE